MGNSNLPWQGYYSCLSENRSRAVFGSKGVDFRMTIAELRKRAFRANIDVFTLKTCSDEVYDEILDNIHDNLIS